MFNQLESEIKSLKNLLLNRRIGVEDKPVVKHDFALGKPKIPSWQLAANAAPSNINTSSDSLENSSEPAVEDLE